MKLWHWASFERDNYGDNLYSYILSSLCAKLGVEYQAVGFYSDKAKEYGSPDMVSYKTFLRKHRRSDFLVVGGGEIMGTGYERLLGYIDREVDTGSLPRFPYIPNNVNCRTACISFGGIMPNSIYAKDVFKAFKNSLWSRDSNTFNEFGSRGVLAPDLATILSDIIPNSESEGYTVFQCGINKCDGWKGFISGNIDPTADITLLPFSTALGHGDDIILKEIESELGEYKRIVGIENISRYISKANNTAGTSLHLMVISDSYGIPHKPMNVNTILKLGNYYNTWLDSPISLSERKNKVYKALSRLLPFGEITDKIWLT